MESLVQSGMATPPRLTWLFTPYPLFYITACAYNRRPILARSDVHNSFKIFALRGPEYGVWVGRYVIMPDHMHVFAAFDPEATGLSRWMKSLKNAISKTLNRGQLPAPHWEKGFFDHLIRSAESYEQKWMYVRDNPVRAGLVRDANDWEYAGEIFVLSLTETKNVRS
jgi:putative transposase